MSIKLPNHMQLFSYDEVSSTMDLARHHAHTTIPGDIAVVWAKSQMSGRGRRGRQWVSSEGNLFVSFVAYPTVPVQRVYELSFVGSLAIGDALAELGVENYKLKWPNDIFIEDAKISGVLLELETFPHDRFYVVIGIGMNVKHAPSKMMYETTYVEKHCGQPVEVRTALEKLSHSLARRLSQWEQEGFVELRSEWLEKSLLKPGDPVVVKTIGETLEGHMVDLDDAGVLLVKDVSGEVKRVSAGDVYF